MVNKQYNVQNLSKNKTNKNLKHIDTEILKQSITVIPNETIVNGAHRVDDIYQTQNAFMQQYYHNLTDSPDIVDGHLTGDDSMVDIVKNRNNSVTDNDSQSQKQLTINDIGRFQYILQMDREMVRFLSHFFSLFKCIFGLILGVIVVVNIDFDFEVRRLLLIYKKITQKKKQSIQFHYVIIDSTNKYYN